MFVTRAIGAHCRSEALAVSGRVRPAHDDPFFLALATPTHSRQWLDDMSVVRTDADTFGGSLLVKPGLYVRLGKCVRQTMTWLNAQRGASPNTLLTRMRNTRDSLSVCENALAIRYGPRGADSERRK
jgi:hypothetical protein